MTIEDYTINKEVKMKNLIIMFLLIPMITFAQYPFKNGVFPEI